MQVTDLGQYDLFFGNFHGARFYFDDPYKHVKSKLSSANYKIEQIKYCTSQISHIIDIFKEDEDTYTELEFEVLIKTYLESIIITSRTVIDLSINAMLTNFDNSNSIDSFSEFKKKIAKGNFREKLNNVEKFEEIINQLDIEKMNWQKAIFPRSNSRSLRDKIVHKQDIRFEVSYDTSDNPHFHFELGEKYKEFIVVQDVKQFVENLNLGVNKLLLIIKDEIRFI